MNVKIVHVEIGRQAQSTLSTFRNTRTMLGFATESFSIFEFFAENKALFLWAGCHWHQYMCNSIYMNQNPVSFLFSSFVAHINESVQGWKRRPLRHLVMRRLCQSPQRSLWRLQSQVRLPILPLFHLPCRRPRPCHLHRNRWHQQQLRSLHLRLLWKFRKLRQRQRSRLRPKPRFCPSDSIRFDSTIMTGLHVFPWFCWLAAHSMIDNTLYYLV